MHLGPGSCQEATRAAGISGSVDLDRANEADGATGVMTTISHPCSTFGWPGHVPTDEQLTEIGGNFSRFSRVWS
jgi:hypothetical protein